MAIDIGLALNAVRPQDFVTGYTLGEELALKKEQGASEIAARGVQADIGREVLRQSQVAASERESELQRSLRDATARVQLLQQRRGEILGQSSFEVLQQNPGKLAEYNQNIFDTAVLNADITRREATQKGDNLGVKMAIETENLLNEYAQNPQRLRTANLEAEVKAIELLNKKGTAQDMALARTVEQAASGFIGQGMDEYAAYGEAAKAAQDPVSRAYAQRKQKQISKQAIQRAGEGGNIPEFVNQYNRLHSGDGQRATQLPTGEVLIEVEETIQDPMTGPMKRWRRQEVINTKGADGMFQLARRALSEAGVAPSSQFAMGTEAGAQAREVTAGAAATRAGGGTGQSATQFAGTRVGGGAPPATGARPSTQAVAPVVPPVNAADVAAANVANRAGLEAGDMPAAVPPEATTPVPAAEPTIASLLQSAGVQAPRGASTQELIGLAQTEMKDLEKTIQQLVAAPNTSNNFAQLQSAIQRRETINQLLAKLGPRTVPPAFGVGGREYRPAPPAPAAVTPARAPATTPTIGIRG